MPKESPDDDDQARLHIADLVHTLKFALLREPLFQFLVLGTALFGLFHFVDSRKAEAPERIVVSSARIANLADGFARTWQRPPGSEELQGLVDDYIRDEVFYREGRAAGLDRDDVIIRRRVRQKMEFFAEDASIPEPTERPACGLSSVRPGALQDRGSCYVPTGVPERDPARGAPSTATAKQLAERPGARGRGGGHDARSAIPSCSGRISRPYRKRVAGVFGDGFAKRLSVIEPGHWQGPIPSSFGQHFVYVSERIPGSVPPLDAVRDAVRREWSNARRLEAEQKLYASLRQRYEIVVETPPVQISASRNQPMKRFLVFFAVLGVLLAQPARSDELRPGYLELRQTTPDTYSLLFKIPARGEDLRLAIYVKLARGHAGCRAATSLVRRGCLCRTPHHPPRWRAHRTCGHP